MFTYIKNKILSLIREYGIVNFFYRTHEKILKISYDESEYKYSLSNDLNAKTEVFKERPMISIVVPVFNTPQSYLCEMIESVLAQSYTNFQLCIWNGGSTDPCVDETIKEYARKDPRIVYHFDQQNSGIAINTNKAIQLATGEYVGFLDHDDKLAVNALFECVKKINHSHPDIIYSDEDKISEDGKKHFCPHYKPDWSPDLLRSYNYICHFLVVKSELLYKVNFIRTGVDGSQDYDLILRLSNLTNSIEHIPKILYHWRVHKNSTAGNSFNKNYAFLAGKKSLDYDLHMAKIIGEVQKGDFPGAYKVVYTPPLDIPVSVIFVGHWETARSIIDFLYERKKFFECDLHQLFIINKNNEFSEPTSEKEVEEQLQIKCEIVTGENYLSAVNNIVNKVSTEHIILVDQSITLLNKEWINIMLAASMDCKTAVLGPKIIFKNKVYSYGIAITHNSIIDIHHGIHRKHFGYFGRCRIVQNTSATNPMFILFKKSYCLQVGGFDEDFKDETGILDFCYKARKFGKFIKLIPNELGRKSSVFKEKEIIYDKEMFFKKNVVLEKRDRYFPINERIFSRYLTKRIK